MKIIFLDFDGVLNTEQYIRARGDRGLLLDPDRLRLLKEIVCETDAKIVLSTSWREHWEKNEADCGEVGREMNGLFSEFGLQIFDKTPFSCLDRENDIEAWLAENPQTDAFVVLDDRFLDSRVIRGRFVKTDGYLRGLDERAKNEAISILMKNC